MSNQPKYPLILQLDSDAVEVFKMISDTDKEKLEILVSSLFKEYQKSSIKEISQALDKNE
jgi:hypothetical protein